MAVPANKKHLLVEGKDERHAIPFLVENHDISWGKEKQDWPVHIQDKEGIENILREGVISAHVKSAEIIGIVIDADDNFNGRWQSLRTRCIPMFPNIPLTLPLQGLIVENATERKKLGIWIMPDNKSLGMIETFMQFLVPTTQALVWAHAEQSTKDARLKGANYKDAHIDKAKIYTWLAWQDAPSQSMGGALMQDILNSHSQHAKVFVKWFRRLFEL